MINTFIRNMTYEVLIDMLSRETPRTTRELLDITT
jgi:hypothetical protein